MHNSSPRHILRSEQYSKFVSFITDETAKMPADQSMELVPFLRDSFADKDTPCKPPPLQAEAVPALDIHTLVGSIPRSASGCAVEVELHFAALRCEL
jgi:hypothetical protein